MLSELLTSYIRRHKISTVLDLTADDDYRRLIAWETVRHATNGKLLHAFSNMYTGANALQSYGRLLNQLLAERDKTLHKLKANDKIEVAGTAVTFVDHPDPPSSPATIRSNAKVQEEKDESSTGHKLDVRVTYSDRIGRMRRNYLKVMADILNLNPREDLDFMPRFCRVIEKYPRFSKYKDAMNRFNNKRNNVEYHRDTVNSPQMNDLERTYNDVMGQVKEIEDRWIDWDSLEPLH